MATSISKAQLLEELQQENAAWLALLDEIGEEHMTQPEVAGGWSIKDIVAHITGWRRRTVSNFQAALKREPVAPPPWPSELDDDTDEGTNQVNAWIYEQNRHRPLADVLSDSQAVFQQLFDAVAAFSDEELHDPSRFTWFEWEPFTGSFFFSHFHEEHEPDMRAWLAKVKGGK